MVQIGSFLPLQEFRQLSYVFLLGFFVLLVGCGFGVVDGLILRCVMEPAGAITRIISPGLFVDETSLRGIEVGVTTEIGLGGCKVEVRTDVRSGDLVLHGSLTVVTGVDVVEPMVTVNGEEEGAIVDETVEESVEVKGVDVMIVGSVFVTGCG